MRRVQRKRYVVITLKGIEFAEKWYAVRQIPPRLTRLYQLLLGLIWMRGTGTVPAKQVEDETSVISVASSRGYVKIYERHVRPSETIQQKTLEMIGEAPRWIYA
jgi:hypothetical protein